MTCETDPDFFQKRDEAPEENRRFANPKTFGKRLVSHQISKRRSVLFAFRGLGSALYFLRGTRVDTYGRQFTKL